MDISWEDGVGLGWDLIISVTENFKEWTQSGGVKKIAMLIRDHFTFNNLRFVVEDIQFVLGRGEQFQGHLQLDDSICKTTLARS